MKLLNTRHVEVGEIMKKYDVIVIGSGCGINVVDESLAHGLSVALVDKGQDFCRLRLAPRDTTNKGSGRPGLSYQ